MSENKPRKGFSNKGGVLNDLTNRIKLIVRLMGDSRVNPILKLLPIGSLVYLVMPDILIGPIDDAAVIWLGAYLFVELCPPYVVQEHMAALNQEIPGQWHDPVTKDEDVVDGEWEEK